MQKRSLIALLLVACLLLAMLPAGLAAESPAQDAPAPQTGEVTLRYVQKALGQSVLTVTVEKPEALAAADTLQLNFNMSYKGSVTRSYQCQKPVAELTGAEPSFEVTLPYFGKWQATATWTKNGQTVAVEPAVPVALGVSECNIMVMYATLDMLIESIKFSAGKDAIEAKGMVGLDESIPTIVGVCRNKQYDWDKLPANLYPVPLTTDEQTRQGMNYSEHMDAMSQYVAELYEINPDTVFNFYLNDVHLYVFPKLCYQNKLPASQYTLTLVTDGSGSYATFRNAYTNSTIYSQTGAKSAEELHEKYIEQYLAFRQNIINGQVEDYLADYMGGLQCYWVTSPHQEHSRITNYIYAILDAEERAGCPKTQWWVVRRSTDTFGLGEENAAFQAAVLADPRISNNYINNCLVALENANKTEEFKQLYHFDNSAFQQAREQGKKPLMVLGTAAWTESQLPPLDYIRMMQAFYGDEYAFFYKPHPGNYAMDSEASRKPYLDAGVQVLESSIAAELFDFYDHDLYYAGYSSSFFQNVGTERDLALWNWTREVALQSNDVQAYASKMDFFISELTGEGAGSTFLGEGEVYKALQSLRQAILDLTAPEAQTDRLYLVQFQNTPDHTVAPYDLAVWNANKGTLRYLVQAQDGTVAFASDTEPSPQPSTEPTAKPSTEPTVKPSAEPTAKPSAEPTAKPSTEPTAKPSAEPTTKPTTTPSAQPSVKPSKSPSHGGGSSSSGRRPSSTTTKPTPTASASPAPAVTGPVALAEGESVTVRLTPVADALDAAPKFSDTQGHWAETAIAAMARKGIFQGTDHGFQPDATLDRAQLAAVLFRLSGGKAVKVTGSYRDVSANAWYRDAVNWASVAGVVSGVGNDAFDPSGAVTREQMAAMLYRYAKAAGLDVAQRADVDAFQDASAISDWAADGVSWCVAQGLLKGYPDGTLAPAGAVTRAQAATILQRFIPQA